MFECICRYSDGDSYAADVSIELKFDPETVGGTGYLAHHPYPSQVVFISYSDTDLTNMHNIGSLFRPTVYIYRSETLFPFRVVPHAYPSTYVRITIVSGGLF